MAKRVGNEEKFVLLHKSRYGHIGFVMSVTKDGYMFTNKVYDTMTFTKSEAEKVVSKSYKTKLKIIPFENLKISI
jgi:hypothetical protein